MKTTNVKKLLLTPALVMAAIMVISGCGGGGKGGAAVAIDNTNAAPANAIITGKVTIKGQTDCSGVVVVADKVVAGVTRTVDAMLAGAKAGRKVEARSADATGVYMTTTGANCSFTLTVPEDTYSVSAYKEETVGAQPQRITARSSASVIVNFDLVATGKIAGVVHLGNAGSDVVIVYLDGTSFAAFASSEGAYTISNVPVGTYTIKFSRAGVIYASNDGVVALAGATTNDSLTSVNFLCVKDPDCNDNDKRTIDTCQNAATVSSACDNNNLAVSLARKVSIGANHACAVQPDTTVKCWGYNGEGALGDGLGGNSMPRRLGAAQTAAERKAAHKSPAKKAGRQAAPAPAAAAARVAASMGNGANFSIEPVTALGVTGAVSVTAKGNHSCALIDDGTVRCWGYNGDGQLGDGVSTDYTNTPVTVSDGAGGALSNVIQIDNGWNSTCALISDGTVNCWGYGDDGTLGNGTWNSSNVPVQVSGLTGATQISVGGGTACAIIANGAVKCWGYNDDGELGNGTTTYSNTPFSVTGISGATALGGGEYSECAIVANGDVKCWGYNGDGDLGDGTTNSSLTPVSVQGITGAIAISGGQDHHCAVLSGENAKCWGYNYIGQLGIGITADMYVTSPVAVTEVTGTIVNVSAGNDSTCFILSGGDFKCVGKNDNGQLGNGRAKFYIKPVSEFGITDALGVTIGRNSKCMKQSNGSVMCWGNNPSGILGDGTDIPRENPVEITVFNSALDISTSNNYTCAVLSGGGVSCVGTNYYGLGDGINQFSITPVSVSGITGASLVSSGPGHACAIVSGGDVYCWGLNYFGQLGNSTNTDAPTPVQVSGLTGATDISAGGDQTCAIISGGIVQCWGQNVYGELGNGTTSDSNAPITVTGITGATEIYVSNYFACALIDDGSVKCWGDNGNGQLGDGTTTNSTVPVTVSGLSGSATGLAIGSGHSCALISNGSVQCWGNNNDGELGDNSTIRSSSPVSVYGITDATAVYGGENSNCALSTSKGLLCWGQDQFIYGTGNTN